MEAATPPRRRRTDADIALSASRTLALAVWGLIVVAVCSVVATAVLAYASRPTPDAVIGVGSAAVGALATLLARAGRVDQ